MQRPVVTVLILLSILFSLTVYAQGQNKALNPILSLLLGGTPKYTGPPLAHQAVIVGPLAEAKVSAFRITSLDTTVEGPATTPLSDNLLAAGTFDLSLAGVADTEWVVVAVTGGRDIDPDGDGQLGPGAAVNKGTLHALAKAGDWKTRHFRVSPFTELAWRFTENLISTVSPADLEIRLADIARYLIKTDIDGSGSVDWYDILAFDPADTSHHAKLATSYDWLTTPDADGNSVMQSLLGGDEPQMLSCMDATYTWLMTRFPAPDSRYSSVKLTLSVFGQGSASSGAPYNLSVDSTAANPVYEDHIFLPENEATLVTFTAVPATGAQILSWSGCETVIADLSQCTIPMNRSRSVVANFGSTTASLKGILHDLSRTTNVLTATTIAIQIPDDMADMIAEMATASVDDFVVGDDNGGFLRRITGITQNSTTSYNLDTVDAALDEVIGQGTGHLYKMMENSDLDGYVPAQAGQSATLSPQAFTGLDGVSLVPSDNPNDRTFTIVLGQPGADGMAVAASGPSISSTVTLYDDGQGGTLEASGTIAMDISLDTGFDYSFISGLRSFKFITIVDAEESVDFTASAELAKLKKKTKIGTLHFSPIVFTIGVVPVWVTPTVDVFLFAEGKIEAQMTVGIAFSQRIEGGLLYNRDTGFSIHSDFSMDFTPTPPTAKIVASLKGGLEASSVLKIYSATGPAIPLEAYLKLEGSASTEVFGTCSDVLVEFLAGAEASFMWDLSGSSKIGQMLHLDKLENKTRKTLFTLEWPIKEWTLYDNCPALVQGSHLFVEGNGIFFTIDEGDPNNLATTLTIKNTGDETLDWNTSGIPAEVLVSPSSGSLVPGGQVLVQVSVATATLPVGSYLKNVFFYNEASVGTGLPDADFGNTSKTIDVTVNGTIIDAPVITAATSTVVGEVTLSWTFTPSGSDPFVGFQIFATETPADPASYQQIYTTDIYSRTATIFGFTPGSTWSFDMRAYTNNGAAPGPFSNKVSVTIAGNSSPPPGTVISAGGRIWMDRNLGASQVATSSTDTLAYGDLYQWGRLEDGHQVRTSPTTSTLSTSNVPVHGSFILSTASPYDWRTPQNNTLWQGVSGTNNPCPSGFRLPTDAEWEIERLSWSTNNAAGAFGSPLKLVAAGYRNHNNGTPGNVGSNGNYWSSTVNGINSRYLIFHSSNANMDSYYRAYGFSVCCLKDWEETLLPTVAGFLVSLGLPCRSRVTA